jgi:hypothetical protein
MAGDWPELSLREIQPTLAALHRWTQIVGKTRLALAPAVNHWWHVSLYVTARGLTTSPMPCDGRMLEVSFDFIDHRLLAATSDGALRSIPLESQSVADFYRAYRQLLQSLDVHVPMWPVPVELPDTLRFDADHQRASYDPDAARRLWLVLGVAADLLATFRGHEAVIRPGGASYHVELREWLLPYDVARRSADPEATVGEFLESTYDVAANLGGWNRAELERLVGEAR